MTIVAVHPPMVDPRDGHLLVDGAYLNNLPGAYPRWCVSYGVVDTSTRFFLNVPSAIVLFPK